MNRIRTIAKSIKALRIQCSFTQNQLAELIGSTRDNINSWERGIGSPNAEMIVKLKNALNCSYEELLEGEV